MLAIFVPPHPTRVHRVPRVPFLPLFLFALGTLVFLLATSLHAAVPASTTRLTFAELSAVRLASIAANAPAEDVLPASVRDAEGRTVEITGYMLPLAMEQGRARELVLMRNQMGCCYGKMPEANEYVVVKAPAPGLPVMMDVPIALRGTWRVAPVVVGGALVEFYHLDDASAAAH